VDSVPQELSLEERILDNIELGLSFSEACIVEEVHISQMAILESKLSNKIKQATVKRKQNLLSQLREMVNIKLNMPAAKFLLERFESEKKETDMWGKQSSSGTNILEKFKEGGK